MNAIIFSLVLAISCAGTPQTTLVPKVNTPPKQTGVIVTTDQNLYELKGQQIEIQGNAQASKAGAFLQLEDGRKVWCIPNNWDWGEFYGKKVRVIGQLSEGSSPLDNFPVATKNEKGEWSQGVSSPSMSLTPTPPEGFKASEKANPEAELKAELDKIKPKPIEQTTSALPDNTKGGKKSGGSLLIKIQKVSFAE